MEEIRQVLFQSDPRWSASVDEARLRQAVTYVLQNEDVDSDAELALVLVDDAEITRLNEAFRGHPYPTDVLSFPFEDEGVDEEMTHYLGDVIIGYEQAARQAVEEGHSVEEELVLLAVHGTLHLLGYDDEDPQAKEQMWTKQRSALEQLGLAHIAPR